MTKVKNISLQIFHQFVCLFCINTDFILVAKKNSLGLTAAHLVLFTLPSFNPNFQVSANSGSEFTTTRWAEISLAFCPRQKTLTPYSHRAQKQIWAQSCFQLDLTPLDLA